VTERFLNLSTDPNNARFVTRVLEQESNLVRIVTPPGTVPRCAPRHGNPLQAPIRCWTRLLQRLHCNGQ